MGLFSRLFGRVFVDTPRSDATRKPGAWDSKKATQSVNEGMIPVVSSWVLAMKWVAYAGDGTQVGDMFVKFRAGKGGKMTGVTVKYQSIPHDLYDDFFSSSSKGRFVHRYLKGRPYSIVG